MTNICLQCDVWTSSAATLREVEMASDRTHKLTQVCLLYRHLTRLLRIHVLCVCFPSPLWHHPSVACSKARKASRGDLPPMCIQEVHIGLIPNPLTRIDSPNNIGKLCLHPEQSVSRVHITGTRERMKMGEQCQPLPVAHWWWFLCPEGTPSAVFA